MGIELIFYRKKHLFYRKFGNLQKLQAHQALQEGRWIPEDPDGRQEQHINTTSSQMFLSLPETHCQTSVAKQNDWAVMISKHKCNVRKTIWTVMWLMRDDLQRSQGGQQDHEDP